MKRLLFTLVLLMSISATALFAQTVVNVESNITASTTWTSNNIYVLKGVNFIYVTNGATLTIEPGTIIKGDPAALVITRGAKIMAEGTLTRPIVFTSNKPAGERKAGDWGGIALLGRAPINTPGGESTLEGGVDPTLGRYGGTDAADNSGVLKYVRIEFAGIAFQPNNEINSLTMGGVGSGTVIQHVQTSYGGDDSFEWFGGTVNGKYLIAIRTVDDMFDTDFGYVGKNQFVLGVSDPKVADVSQSNGFESDNDATGTSNAPITNGKFANVTLIGPRQLDTTSINALYRRAAHIRRSSRLNIHNSLMGGFNTGLRLESANSITSFLTGGELQLKGNIFAGNTVFADSTATTYPQVLAKLATDGNTTLANQTAFQLNDPFNFSNPSFLPKTGSPVLTGANQDIYGDTYFDKVNYRGAFGTTNWAACWTEFDPINAAYNGAIDYLPGNDFTATVAQNTVAFAGPTTAGITYAWDFGDFTTSTQANPSKTYSALGIYTVKLTISNARGCSKTITKQVTISAGATEVAVNADITTNTTWTNDKVYRLTGAACLYVRNNATLTIQAGTIIKGDPSALIITRGSKIMAEGTADQPIVFTSGKAAGQRKAGDWGGIAILGRAPINTPGGQSTLEGGCDPTLAQYGGTDAEDNSGVLKYVRIEFAGIAFQPNNELNSLTLGAVGNGTTISYVQTSNGGDDAFEWFGGTVNGKYLVAIRTVDDIFDTDFGYTGKNQFVLGLSDPKVADVSQSNGFESDNDATGTANTPITAAKFANVTLVGPRQSDTTTINPLYRRGAHIRRSSRLNIHNSLMGGFNTGIRLESTNSINSYLTSGELQLKGNIFAGNSVLFDSTSTNFRQQLTKFNAENTTLANQTAFQLTDPFNFANPIFLPKSGSPVLTGANQDIYADAFFDKVNYRGAFGTVNWAACWTEFDPNNAAYLSAINYAADITEFTSVVTQNNVAFAGPTAAGLTYAWDFGDFTTSTQSNPTKTYNALGTYTVKLTVTNARGCSKSFTKTVTIAAGTREIAVNADITTNTTWTNDKIYRLTGAACLYVRNNATLTIQPGTIIKGDPSALIITRGSKIMAEGTAEQPIVFTSGKAAGQRKAGDWGGIAILGRAPINTPGGQSTLEGGCDPSLVQYGGTDAADNSGVLKYVRIEFAGIAFQPNNELNSLTLGAVGNGTTISYVQTSNGGDDAFEWFGGTVNGKYLIAIRTVDDIFDTDFGYTGKNQFVLGLSDPKVADVSQSNGFESDNDATGTANTPITAAKFANVTMVGPRQLDTTTINPLYRRGAHIRRSSRLNIHNSLMGGFNTGIRLESTNSINSYLTSGELQLKGNIFAGNSVLFDSTSTNFRQQLTKFNAENSTLANQTAFQLNNPFSFAQPNFVPKAGSPALTGANQDIYADTFFDKVDYRGAFGATNWAACWSEFDPNNAAYDVAPLNYFAGKPTAFTVVSPSNKATFTGPAGAGLKYSWDFGVTTATTDTSSAANPTFVYPAIGSYTATLVVSNARGCSTTLTRAISVATGLDEIKELNAYRLFPNPTAGQTTLELNLTARIDAVVSVRNVAGQVMLAQKQTLLQGINLVELPTANLANGVYTVEVKSTTGIKTLKLMVTRN